ncbi:uncharacterized protein LOC110450742 [Mizuhopecten yessoensis]|uniref:ShKT domain-containing protein n=1 Tax=Mizuhopecten yessoensis TaxID=6573 RepID=A0A210QNC8_MIZYE|nr:uncharacterized protein LOC110450742 [Mizuhopecten yessoensis]OWF50239.1 hypothetical protein KP79_PYT06768 [Mizuhopecten yessoensis]
MYTATAIFLVIIATGVVADTCEDKDAAACTSLMGTIKDMCSEPCIADLCRKTCGLCPLTCYTCKDELYPEECNKTVQCNSVHEYCVAVQELTSNFLPLFQSGCADVNRCLSIFGIINTKRSIHDRAYTLKGGCCDHDKCNYHNPALRPVDPSPPTNVRPVYPDGSLNENICSEQDIDTNFCAALMQSDPNICNTTCVANKLCATSCQTCRKCYNCPAVQDKRDCLASLTCMKGQQCVTVETFGANFELDYRLGCMNTTQCHRFFGIPVGGPAVGRRKRQIQGSCCDTDYCQHGPVSTLPTTAMPTTAVPPTTTMAPVQTMATTNSSQPITTAATGMNVTTASMLASTTTFPCKDYDKSGYCSKYVPLICNTADPLSKKFAIANCALSCNLCDEFYALVASGEIVISP